MIDDPGGGGGLGYPLEGMQMPPGDPGPLDHTASQCSTWSHDLGSGAAGHRSAASGVINSAWIGPDASQAGKSVQQIADGAATMSNAADTAHTVLTTCASTWRDAISEWKQAETLAHQAMTQEAAHRSAATTALNNMTAKQQAADPAKVTQLGDASSGADGYTSPDRSKSVTMGQGAIDKANKAIHTAATSLGGVGGAVRYAGTAPDATKDDFLDSLFDGLSKGNTVVAGFLAIALGKAGGNYATLGTDLAEGFSELSDAKVAEWAQMLKDGHYVPDLVDQMNSFVRGMDLADGAFRADSVKGLIDGGLGFLGDSGVARWGVRGLGALGIAGDVWTMINPDEGGAWGDAERGVAGANLLATGGGMALDFAGDAATLAMVNAGLDWIPVAGQVVAVGTGLYLAGDYLYTHEAWFKNSVNWVGDQVKDTVTSDVHTVEQVGSDIGQGASDAWHAATSWL